MNSRQRRILIIDDDPTLVASLRDSFELLGGYEVITAVDGVSGLEHFFDAAPDCVVVDVRMPQVSGYQFVRALRGDPATAQTPIIVLSALVQEHEQLAGLLTGADAYLLKPVTLDTLLKAVEYALALSAEDRSRRDRALPGDPP
jgi:two-component system alkaline phosphatase synthesis response regulator PhoP